VNVLGVFAHPDDEVLGCGGTLAKHHEAGDRVFTFMFCDRGLHRDARNAGATLGAGQIVTLAYADQGLDRVLFSTLVEDIPRVITDYDPDVVYTHHPGDLNLDHALTARAVLTAFRPKPGEKLRTILACEVLSSTEWTFPQQFQPNWYETLTDEQVKKKKRALECYPSEVQQWPHPRSPYGVWVAAQSRGQQCGAIFAEAFQLLRRGPC